MQQKEAARLNKIQADATEKLKQEALKKTLQYPLLSKIVDAGESINLGNRKVNEWAQKALLEIVYVSTTMLAKRFPSSVLIANISHYYQCLAQKIATVS